jgi:DNA-binding response OmpR family regulator
VPLRLTARESALLAALATQPGRVFSRDELLEAVYGGECNNPLELMPHAIDVIVHRLRRKLSLLGEGSIRTEIGYGFALRPLMGEAPGLGALHIDQWKQVWVHGQVIELPSGQRKLLCVLNDYRNRALTRVHIRRLLGQPAIRQGSRTVDSCVYQLRRSLSRVAVGGVPRVETIRRVGYRLVPGW